MRSPHDHHDDSVNEHDEHEGPRHEGPHHEHGFGHHGHGPGRAGRGRRGFGPGDQTVQAGVDPNDQSDDEDASRPGWGPGGPRRGRGFGPRGFGRMGFPPGGFGPGGPGPMGFGPGGPARRGGPGRRGPMGPGGPEGPGRPGEHDGEEPGFGGPGFGPGFGAGFGPRGFGRGGGFGPGFGPGGFGPGAFGPGRGHHGGRGRRGRGNVRAAVLALLAEQPRHGYALMTELTERSGGLWKPSPGSIYPVLQQLQDEGLVSVAEADGRRVFSLTDEGRAYVTSHADELREPWKVAEHGPRARVQSLMHAATTLAAAVEQVARLSDDTQAARAVAVLEEARRAMYRILAEEGAGEGSDRDGSDPLVGEPGTGATDE